MVGAVTARYYRFDEAVEQARQAIAMDRENWRAYADLGAHLMRTGDERGARRALETAFRGIPTTSSPTTCSNCSTRSTVQTITEGDMVIRLHPDEAA